MLSSLLDILLPGTCPLCFKALKSTRPDSLTHAGATGGLCTDCLTGFVKITGPICTLCGAPFVSSIGASHLCSECIKTKRVPFIKARSALYYSENTQGAIKLFKYNALFALKPAFATLLSPLLPEFRDTDLIVPVPLHRSRLRHRGYNQSLMLARIVAKKLNKRLDYVSLKRTRLTKPQTELKGDERRRNVRGAFIVKGEMSFKEKRCSW